MVSPVLQVFGPIPALSNVITALAARVIDWIEAFALLVLGGLNPWTLPDVIIVALLPFAVTLVIFNFYYNIFQCVWIC